jgi:N-acetylmuramoyl-L-alanine amidase
MLLKDYAETNLCDSGRLGKLNKQVLAEVRKKYPLEDCASLAEIDYLNRTLPYLQPKARAALAKAVAEKDRKIGLNHAYRTLPQQYLIRYWFEHDRCGISAAAQPGRSNHEAGLAIDIKFPNQWRAVLEKHGWKWFGDSDRWHFDFKAADFPAPDAKQETIRAFQTLWNKHNPDDQIGADGLFGAETKKRLLKTPVDGW